MATKKGSRTKGNPDVYTANSRAKNPLFSGKNEKEPETAPEIPQNEQQTEQAIEAPLEPEYIPEDQVKTFRRSLSIDDMGLATKKDTKNKRVSMFCTEEKYLILKTISKNSGCSVNVILNACSDEFIDENRKYWEDEIDSIRKKLAHE